MADSPVQPDDQLSQAVQAVLAASDEQRTAELRRAIAVLRTAEIGDTVRIDALRRLIAPPLEYSSAQSLYRLVKPLLDVSGRATSKIRIAILGSSTTMQLVQFLKLFLFGFGVEFECYEGEYGVFRQEVFDTTSGLYQFQPQIVLLLTGVNDLAEQPELSDTPMVARERVARETDNWEQLWHTLHRQLKCQIIQNNFVLPPARALANLDSRHASGMSRFVSLVNHALADCAHAYVIIHDVDHLAASWGRWEWSDPRFVHQAKLPCSPRFLTDYAHSLASVVAALSGRAKKCLVLDLDNTLWGGVIGDDGLGGIRLGHGDPEGEAFMVFQQYVKSLQLRGVLLAVCSKNDEQIARSVFQEHSDMLLRNRDIVAFVANWNDKAANLRLIAEQLNIGLDALVFVDDNPAERSIVRRLLPQVAVPEMPEDVADFPRVLEQQRYFQVLSVGNEDLQRTEFYNADAARRDLQSSAQDIHSFLASLQMQATVAPINPSTLERSAQLLQRSNQFNLTTRRRTSAELAALLTQPEWTTLTVSLKDRFGDHGLISVVLAAIDGDALNIDTWLMSCRVLKRGVEYLVLEQLIEFAQRQRLPLLRGKYIATAKNALVVDHYRDLGFAQVPTNEPATTLWELSLSEPLPAHRHFIQQEQRV